MYKQGGCMQYRKTIRFLRMLLRVCVRLKAWPAARVSLWLARMLGRSAHVACVPRLRLRQSFSHTLLVHAVWRKHAVSTVPVRYVLTLLRKLYTRCYSNMRERTGAASVRHELARATSPERPGVSARPLTAAVRGRVNSCVR